MIELYQFPRAWSSSSASPYCVKVSLFMKLAKIPFKTVSLMSASRAPHKKLPYIKDGKRIIADSSMIIDYLTQQYDVSLDMHLTALQRAQAEAIKALIEDKLYFILIHARWVDEDTNAVMRRAFKKGLPPVIHQVAFYLARRSAQKQVYYQGIGRHSKQKIYAMGQQILESLAELLGEQDFFMGDKITSIDASAYAFLAALLKTPIEHPLRHWLKSNQRLVAYCERVETLLGENI